MRFIFTHPFRLHNTDLPPELLLTARLVALVLIFRKNRPFPQGITYLRILEIVPADSWLTGSLLIMLAGVFLLFFTPFVRGGSLLIGGILLLSILGCRGCLSNAHLYTAVLFIIIGLSSSTSGKTLLRWQLGVLYFGATLNKMMTSGWWNGAYFDALMIERHNNALYIQLSEIFPGGNLSLFMGLLVMATEGVLIVLVLWPRWNIYAIAVGILFHTAITFTANNTYGPFWYAMLASYIGLTTFPTHINLKLPANFITHQFKTSVSVLGFSHYYRVTISPVFEGIEFCFNHFSQRQHPVLYLLFTTSSFYYVMLLPLTINLFHGWLRNGLAVILLLSLIPIFFDTYQARQRFLGNASSF